MDVARYLKTIQQRVAAGVTTALHEAGYQTDEFEQRIVHVAEGGVYVESAQGAVGIGDHNTITHHSTPGAAPRRREVPSVATADERGKGIHIGSVRGAFAIGDHNTVTHHEGLAAPARTRRRRSCCGPSAHCATICPGRWRARRSRC